jgi:hypothetical protein
MVTTNASDVQVKAFLSVTVLAPNSRADSNSARVGAADTTGWPEKGRDFRLQRELHFSLQKEVPIIFRPAKCAQSASAFPHSSQRSRTAQGS